ncbi:MAG: hypothetical protein AAFR02_12205 [Pseudomonadota bacterium]
MTDQPLQEAAQAALLAYLRKQDMGECDFSPDQWLHEVECMSAAVKPHLDELDTLRARVGELERMILFARGEMQHEEVLPAVVDYLGDAFPASARQTLKESS